MLMVFFLLHINNNIITHDNNNIIIPIPIYIYYYMYNNTDYPYLTPLYMIMLIILLWSRRYLALSGKRPL